MTTPHKIVGWLFVAAFAALSLIIAARTTWSNAASVGLLSAICAVLAGFILIPGIMILKRRWDELSSVISGLICLALFCYFTGNVGKLMRRFDSLEGQNIWFPFVGLALLAAVFILPFRLHKILKPRFLRLFAPSPKRVSATASD